MVVEEHITADLCIEMFRRMLRIRRFEEASERLLINGDLTGGLHMSNGQEGEIVGACLALRADDYMVGNHRSHGHPIGKGANLDRLMAELFGKKTGVCQGKGGSMHLADFSVGSLGETSIVGSGLPTATGAALGAKMLGLDRISLCFFGDGASNEGTFHESLNMAQLWRLPVLFLCENNGYAVCATVAESSSIPRIAHRAAAYGMPGIEVDGQDVIAVYHVVKAAAARARAGEGPSLIEARTYRYHDHCTTLYPSFEQRSVEEIEHWKHRDPIELLRARMIDEFGFQSGALDEVEAQVLEEIEASVQFSRISPLPEPHEAFTHVFNMPLSIGAR